MNKFLLVCALIVLTQQITVEEVYDDAIYFFKGFASTTDYKCYNTLVTKKTDVIKILNQIVDDIKNGKSIMDAFKAHALQFLLIYKFSENCNLTGLLAKVMNMLNEKGVKDIGYNIINNNSDIYTLLQEIYENKELKVRAEDAGKLLRIISGLNVL